MIEAPETVASSLNRQAHKMSQDVKANYENHPLMDKDSYDVIMQSLRKITEETQKFMISEIINKDMLVEK